MKRRTSLTLSIDSIINQRLKTIASEMKITKSDLIENILQEYSEKEYQNILLSRETKKLKPIS